MAETKREAQGIAGLRGYSAYQEALEVILQVSWRLCSLHPLHPSHDAFYCRFAVQST